MRIRRMAMAAHCFLLTLLVLTPLGCVTVPDEPFDLCKHGEFRYSGGDWYVQTSHKGYVSLKGKFSDGSMSKLEYLDLVTTLELLERHDRVRARDVPGICSR